MPWLIAAASLLALWALVLWPYRRDLRALWREPVLRHPVLIVESDDWGPGPASDAPALDALTDLLLRYRDAQGHPPVMTLGVVLGAPDGAAIRAAGGREYRRLALAEPRFRALRRAMARGVEAGVLDLQLHGGEHFWPPSVLAAAERDPTIRRWLESTDVPDARELPSHLQSRWTDASALPSRSHPREAVWSAAREEVAEFHRTFGRPALVAVPPTFVWGAEVERAWASAGVRWVVTPGERNAARGADGSPVREGPALRNGEAGAGQVRYLVRRTYFEPELGHRAEQVLAALDRDRRLGRPTLTETHRTNFVGEPAKVERAREELARALARALEAHPDLRFLSTLDLAERMVAPDPGLAETRRCRRLAVWVRRAAELPRLRKLAWASGLVAAAGALLLFSRLCRSSPG